MEHGARLRASSDAKSEKIKAVIFLLLENICLQGLLSVVTTTALASGETGEKRQDARERLRAVNSGDVKRCARGENRKKREGGVGRGAEGRGGEGRGEREGRGSGGKRRELSQAQCGWKLATWKMQTYKLDSQNVLRQLLLSAAAAARARARREPRVLLLLTSNSLPYV